VFASVALSASLVLLGTAGGPTPKKQRAAPAQAIVVGDRIYVVDAGNGVGRQMRLAGLPFANLRHVFLTHHHSDHASDLVTLPLLAWAAGLESNVVLHGPAPLKAAVKAGLKANAFDVETRIVDEGRPDLRDLVAVHEFRKDGVVLKDDRLTVTAARVEHPPIREAYAYRFDGDGWSVVISGDTAPCANLVRLAKGADVLVHEVLILDDDGIVTALGKPRGDPLVEHVLRSHTRFRDVGRVAAEAGVKALVLSHYVPGDASFDREAVLAEIRKTYAGEVIFGEDLMALELPRTARAAGTPAP
jgi:ribonuclease BN (tRNA processing enzyme)